VPRIGKGPAVDAATDQLLELRQHADRLAQSAVLNLAVPGAAATEDLAEEAHRRRRDAPGLGAAGLGIAHFGEQESEVALLQLSGAVAGEVAIEVLPRR